MTTRPRSSRWMLGAFSLALLLFVGLLAFNRPITTSLPDGTTFELASLDVAPTNLVVRGTLLGRVVERWIPPNGWKVGKFEVKRPQRLTLHNQGRSDLLVAAIRLRPGSPREKHLLQPPPTTAYRVQVIGDDGYAYVESNVRFVNYPDGVFSIIVTPRFPRESPSLRFRLEERHPDAPTGWREIATLIAPNPKPLPPKDWQADPSNILRVADNLEAEFGELTISTNEIEPRQFWVNSALLPVRFRSKGRIETNWSLQYGSIRDSLGNFSPVSFDRFSLFLTNEWVRHRIEWPLSPRAPWRFDTHIAQFADFPLTNLYRFQIAWPLKFPIKTNFSGTPAVIDFVNTDMLRVELPDEPPGRRLTFVEATDANGKRLDEWAGSWNQHRFWKMLRLSQPTNILATIAIHTNYPVRFTIQPSFRSNTLGGPRE